MEAFWVFLGTIGIIAYSIAIFHISISSIEEEQKSLNLKYNFNE